MGILERTIRRNWITYYIARTLHEYFLSNIFFENECKVFKYLNKRNNLVIVDIGSSNKVFSKSISKYFYNSKFYCFEPLHFLHKQLKIDNNNNKSFLIKRGCGEKSKKILIYIPYKKIFNIHCYFKFFSSIDMRFLIKNLNYYFKNKNFFFKKKTISIKKLDSFKLNPNIIKIDTENYEEKIIYGALKTIKKTRPIIIVENPSKKVDHIFKKIKYQKYQYDHINKKFKKIKKNNKHSYNYFFLTAEKSVNTLFEL